MSEITKGSILQTNGENEREEIGIKKITQIHCGQYKRYGDFFRVWEIETDEQDDNKVLEYCQNEICKKKIPSFSEWKPKIMHGGSEFGNPNYYFAGYCKLEKIENGYKYTVCEPYCD